MAPVDKMMKALRFHPDTKEFSLDEIPVPKLNEEDNVLVKVAAAGFCGTDLHIMAVNIIKRITDQTEMWFNNIFKFDYYNRGQIDQLMYFLRVSSARSARTR